jgi:hypothetical protein
MNETSDAAPTVSLPDGSRFPALGLGTWHMGERARTRADEIAAVRLALQLGYRPGPVPTPDASALPARTLRARREPEPG